MSNQLQVEVALTGASEFGSQLDTIDQKMRSVATDAGTAAGSGGIGGLGTAATSANTPVNTLASSSQSLATKIGAITGVVAGVAGGILNLVSSYDSLARSQTAVERADKNVETATTAHEKAVDALNKIMEKGTLTQGEYEKALSKVSTTEQTVQKDKENLALAEQKLIEQQDKYGTNSPQYAAAYLKVQNAENKLQTDTGKAADAQKALTDLMQRHVDTTSPAYIEAVQKVKSTQDALTVAQEKAKEAQTSLNIAQDQFYLSIASTGLQAIGSVATAIAIFGRNTGPAVQGMQAMETEAQAMPLKMGVIGVILAAIAAALLLIGTNAFGIRDKLESFGKAVGDANPALKGLMEILHGIGGEIGLTGKGFGSGTDEIVKGSKDIGDAARNFDPFKTAIQALGEIFPQMAAQIKPDIDKLQTAIGDFFAHPSGKTALDLGKALNDAFNNAFDYVYQHLPAMITTLGEKFNAALKAGLPTLDQIGAAIIKGIQSAVDNIPGVVDKILNAIQTAFTAKGIDTFRTMATGAFNAFVTEAGRILGTLFDPKNTPQLHAALDSLIKDLSSRWNIFVQQVVTYLQQIPAAITKMAGTFWKAIADGVKKDWDLIIKAVTDELDRIKTYIITLAVNFWKAISDGIKKDWDIIVKAVTDELDNIKKYVTTLAANFWKAISDGIKKDWDAIVSAVQKELDLIKTYVSTLAQNFWKAISDGIQKDWDAIVAAVKLELDKIKTYVTTLAQNFWKAISDGIQRDWDAIVSAVKTQIDKIPAYIKQVATGLWDSWLTEAKKIADQIQQYFLGVINAIKQAIQSIPNAITGGGGQGGGPPGNPQGSSPYGPVPGQIPGGGRGQGSNQAAYYGGPPLGTFGWAATYNPNAAVSTAATGGMIIVVNSIIDGKTVSQTMKRYATGTSAFT